MEGRGIIKDAVQSVSSTCSYLLGSPNTRRTIDQRIKKLTSVRDEDPKTFKECRKRYVKMTSLRHKCFRRSQELVDEEKTKNFLEQPNTEESFWFRASVIAQGSKAGLLWDRLVDARVEKLRRTKPECIYSIACDKALPPVGEEKLKAWKDAFGFVYGDELMVAYDGLNRMLAKPHPSLSEDTVQVLRRFRDGLRTTGLLVDTVKTGKALVEKDEDLDEEVLSCFERLMDKYCDQLKALKAGEFSLFSAGGTRHAVLVMVVRQDDGTFSQVYFNTGYKMLTKDDTDSEGKVRCFVRHDGLSEKTLLRPHYWINHASQPCQTKENNSELMDECNEWITAIGKQGREWSGSEEEMRLLRMCPQFQRTCAWKCLIAAFRYGMLAPPHGSKDNFVQFRLATELWLQSTLKGVPRTSCSGRTSLLYLQAQKRLNRGIWTRQMCNVALSPKLYSSAVATLSAGAKIVPDSSTERYRSLRAWEKFIFDYDLASTYWGDTTKGKPPLFMKFRNRGSEFDWAQMEKRASRICEDDTLAPNDQALELCELFELAPARRSKHRRIVWIAKILDDLPYEAAGELISDLTILYPKEARDIIDMFIKNESTTMRAALCYSLDHLTPSGYRILVDLCANLCSAANTRALGLKIVNVLRVTIRSYAVLVARLAENNLLEHIDLLDLSKQEALVPDEQVNFLIEEIESLEALLPEKAFTEIRHNACRALYDVGRRKMGSFLEWYGAGFGKVLPFLFNGDSRAQLFVLELIGRFYEADPTNRHFLGKDIFFPDTERRLSKETLRLLARKKVDRKCSEKLLYIISGIAVSGSKWLAKQWKEELDLWKQDEENEKLCELVLEQLKMAV